MFGEIRNQSGEKLDYAFHQGHAASKRVVVLGHGVTGNKDRPLVTALAHALAAEGIHALRFSYAGNGDSEGRFEDATISKEVGDLGAVLDALDGYAVCYAGHSMGGAVGVLRASEDARIRSLISLAGMVDTKGFAQREFGDVTPGAGNMWDDPACPLSQAYLDDLTAIGTVADRAARISAPWLLVHGTEDDVVPLGDSRAIFERANEPKKLAVLQGADHVFSGDATQAARRAILAWLKE